jgi:hypothetical protein
MRQNATDRKTHGQAPRGPGNVQQRLRQPLWVDVMQCCEDIQIHAARAEETTEQNILGDEDEDDAIAGQCDE